MVVVPGLEPLGATVPRGVAEYIVPFSMIGGTTVVGIWVVFGQESGSSLSQVTIGLGGLLPSSQSADVQVDVTGGGGGGVVVVGHEPGSFLSQVMIGLGRSLSSSQSAEAQVLVTALV